MAASMSRGQPRSESDTAGRAYDGSLRQKKAADVASAVPPPTSRLAPPELHSWDGRTRKSRVAHPTEVNSIGDWVQDRIADFQDGPYIGHTSAAEEFIPIYGPVRNGLAYLQDGDYGSAAVSGVEAALDGLMLVPGANAAVFARKAAAKGLKLGLTRRSANAVSKAMHRKGVASALEEIHHPFGMGGIGRMTKSLRNYPMLLKVLPKVEHRRMHGKWTLPDGTVLPKYSLIKRLHIGTPSALKAAAAAPPAVASRALPQSPVDPDRD